MPKVANLATRSPRSEVGSLYSARRGSYMRRVWCVELDSPLVPLDAALRLGRDPGLSWLDGGLRHGREGRYSFVASQPVETRDVGAADLAPLATLASLASTDPDGSAAELSPGDVPRWVGHIAYDAHPVASARFRHARSLGPPLLHFMRYDALFAYDHAHDRALLVGDDAAACAQLAERLTRAPLRADQLAFLVGALDWTPAAAHQAAITRALQHVREGDVYEINLARRLAGSFQGAELGLFLAMRDRSPVPFGFFQAGAHHSLLGRSMERYLRYRASDRALWSSPIKGTIERRGDDAREADALRSDAKEHAEHAMVIDLMRDDLSRVCEIGSVEVEEAFTVWPFAGLSHLISTVRGSALADLSLERLVAQTFPPGSVTGTPKVRALGLIEELEGHARGVYTGAYGFVDRAGGLSLSVAIRTALVREGTVEYFAGGGIVWGSDPARETAETELKARMFLDAAAQRAP